MAAARVCPGERPEHLAGTPLLDQELTVRMEDIHGKREVQLTPPDMCGHQIRGPGWAAGLVAEDYLAGVGRPSCGIGHFHERPGAIRFRCCTDCTSMYSGNWIN